MRAPFSRMSTRSLSRPRTTGRALPEPKLRVLTPGSLPSVAPERVPQALLEVLPAQDRGRLVGLEGVAGVRAHRDRLGEVDLRRQGDREASAAALGHGHVHPRRREAGAPRGHVVDARRHVGESRETVVARRPLSIGRNEGDGGSGNGLSVGVRDLDFQRGRRGTDGSHHHRRHQQSSAENAIIARHGHLDRRSVVSPGGRPYSDPTTGRPGGVSGRREPGTAPAGGQSFSRVARRIRACERLTDSSWPFVMMAR